MEKPNKFEPILEEPQKQVFLECLSDNSIRRIIPSITDVPKSVIEISRDENIPIRTVYRKIQFLADNKLVKISGAITESGKKFFLYKSKFRGISTSYINEELTVEVIHNVKTSN